MEDVLFSSVVLFSPFPSLIIFLLLLKKTSDKSFREYYSIKPMYQELNILLPLIVDIKMMQKQMNTC